MVAAVVPAPEFETEEVEEVVVRIPINKIRRYPNQPRTYFDRTKLDNLKNSIDKWGQSEPISVRKLDKPDEFGHTYELVNGECRFRVMKELGLKTIKAIVRIVTDERMQFRMAVLANFSSGGHGPLEIVASINRFREDQMTVLEIAGMFGMSQGWVYLYITVADKLCPEAQELMSLERPEGKRLEFSKAVVITALKTPKLQLMTAKAVVDENLKMAQVRELVQRTAKKHGFKVGNPKRNPGMDRHVLRNVLAKMYRELEIYANKPQDFFDKMFEYAGPDDNALACSHIEKSTKWLEKLHESVKAAKKK